MNPSRNPVAALYCRTSRDDIEDPRLSIEVQIERGRELATREGLEVNQQNIFVDRNLSGKLPPTRWCKAKPTKRNHRPALEALMVALESRNVHALVVRHRDRLFRSLELALKFFRFLEQHHIALYATDDSIAAGNSASAKLQLNILMAVTQYQLDYTRENVLRAKAKQRREGLKMGPCFTFGYEDGDERGEVTLLEGEPVETVREIYRRYIAGETVGSLVRWLNTEKSHLHNTYGKEFYHSSVRRILTNPHYIGMVRDGDGKLIASAAYKPIISADTFKKVERAMESRRNPKHGRKVADHLLSGFLVCGCCGSSLRVYSRYHRRKKCRVGFEYKCVNTACPRPRPFTMRETRWDHWIEVALRLGFFGMVREHDPLAKDQVAQLQLRLDVINRSMASLRDRIERGDQSFDDGEEMLVRLTSNARKINLELDAAQAERRDFGLEGKRWEDLSFLQQRDRLDHAVEHIAVFSDFAVLVPKGNGQAVCYPLLKRAFDTYHLSNTLVPSELPIMQVVKYRVGVPNPPAWLEGILPALPPEKCSLVVVNMVPPGGEVPSPTIPPSIKRVANSVEIIRETVAVSEELGPD